MQRDINTDSRVTQNEKAPKIDQSMGEERRERKVHWKKLPASSPGGRLWRACATTARRDGAATAERREVRPT